MWEVVGRGPWGQVVPYAIPNFVEKSLVLESSQFLNWCLFVLGRIPVLVSLHFGPCVSFEEKCSLRFRVLLWLWKPA